MPFSTLAKRSPHASKTQSFLVGLGQMFLMCANIKNMANGNIVFAAGFTVINTYVWLYVVRSAIHATKTEKFAYAIGSAGGAVVGILFSHYVIQPLAFTHLASAFR